MADAAIRDWLDSASGLIAVASAAAGVAIFVTRSLFQVKQERLKAQLEEKEKSNSALELRYRQLLGAGNLLSNMKQVIDDEFGFLADQVAATAGAIFVAAPSYIANEEPRDLVFFTVLGDSGAALNRQRVPIALTDAGKAFKTGEPILSGGAPEKSSFSRKTDQAANFQTETKLSIPLLHRQRCVGVAQFLNKRKDTGFFTEKDLKILVHQRDVLGARVGEFVKEPDNLRRIGITPSENSAEATGLFADISNSSRLMHSLNTAQVIDMLNQYFEELCDVALRHGGTVDQFLGDGFMVTFNAKRAVTDHEVTAVEAALQMQTKFSALKKRWVAFGYNDTPTLFNRIGVCSGPVRKAELGHSQYRYITVMGNAVNLAKHLCELGDRNRNVIVISEGTKSKLPQRAIAKRISASAGTNAYELDPTTLSPQE